MTGFQLSPKVYVPFFLAALAIAVQWIVTGTFDRVEVGESVLAAGYALVGLTAPPLPGTKATTQELAVSDVAVHRRKR